MMPSSKRGWAVSRHVNLNRTWRREIRVWAGVAGRLRRTGLEQGKGRRRERRRVASAPHGFSGVVLGRLGRTSRMRPSPKLAPVLATCAGRPQLGDIGRPGLASIDSVDGGGDRRHAAAMEVAS